MTPRQPRDTALSCPGCGWRGKLTTPRLASAALAKHSCERTRREAALTARGKARDAAVDRTPKPCMHTRVRHEHGQRNTYTLDRCRCLPCCAAVSQYAAWLARQHAYGRHPLVDAGPVREHVRELATSGMGWRHIARQAGVAPQMVSRLLFGGGVDGGRPVLRKQVRRDHAEALLAVRPGQLAAGTPVDIVGTARRLQALVAAGWPARRIAIELGMSQQNFTPVLHGRRGVLGSTRDRVTALYEQLWDVAPRQDTPGQRGGVVRARRMAERYGWAPPAAWDDDTIDDPAARPNLTGGHDEATVLAWLIGYVAPDGASRADRNEVIRRLIEDGFTAMRQLRLLTGLPEDEVLAARIAVYRKNPPIEETA